MTEDHGEGIVGPRPETATGGPAPSPTFIQPWDSDHTALVHVLWAAEREGLTFAEADEMASFIMHSRWMAAVKLHLTRAVLSEALAALGNTKATNWERVQAAGLILSRHLDDQRNEGTEDHG